MKTSIKLFALGMILAGFGINAHAQVTGLATASATIVKPIAISKSVDMNFGNVAVSTTSGTVVLATAGTRTKSGGVTLPGTAGTVTAATFDVTGEGNYTYTISLPASISLTGSVSGTMVVDNFTSNPSETGTLASGSQTLKVGATLNVGGSQPAGTYTNATDLKVTVNYN